MSTLDRRGPRLLLALLCLAAAAMLVAARVEGWWWVFIAAVPFAVAAFVLTRRWQRGYLQRGDG